MTAANRDAAWDIAVSIENPAWTGALADIEARLAAAARAAIEAASPDLGEAELSLLLTDDAEVQVLNRDWRDKDRPTNVLSFPAQDLAVGETPAPEFPGTPLILGDIALAFETCAREAREQGKSLADHATHLTVHGVLHLFGHDHMDEDEAERMEDLERRILAGLGIADPYRDGAAAPDAESEP